MKISHLTSVHNSQDVRIFHKECVSLAKAGYETYLIAPNVASEVRNDVQIRGFFLKSKNRLIRMTVAPLRIIAEAMKIKPDIVHLHDPELLGAGILLKWAGKCVIYDAHEDIIGQISTKAYIPAKMRKAMSWVVQVAVKYGTGKMDYIVTATDAIRDKLNKFNDRTEVIYNYPLISEMEGGVGVGAKKNEVCYIGGISKIRGINQIIEALGYTKNIRANIAGDYSPATYGAELKSLKGWEKVNYYGLVSRKDIYRIMEKSRAGLVTFLPVPNHIEAQPNKIFEYMSAGIPLIASNFPLWKKIVEENRCGICVDPEDPKEIAWAMEYLISHELEASQMGENGRQAVLNKYNWGVQERELIRIYDHLARKRGMRGRRLIL